MREAIKVHKDSKITEQPHQLGLAIPLRSIASRLCGALGAPVQKFMLFR